MGLGGGRGVAEWKLGGGRGVAEWKRPIFVRGELPGHPSWGGWVHGENTRPPPRNAPDADAELSNAGAQAPAPAGHADSLAARRSRRSRVRPSRPPPRHPQPPPNSSPGAAAHGDDDHANPAGAAGRPPPRRPAQPPATRGRTAAGPRPRAGAGGGVSGLRGAAGPWSRRRTRPEALRDTPPCGAAPSLNSPAPPPSPTAFVSPEDPTTHAPAGGPANGLRCQQGREGARGGEKERWNVGGAGALPCACRR